LEANTVRTSVALKLTAALVVWSLCSLIGIAQTTGTRAQTSAPKAPPAIVNINTATTAEFVALPGIGPALAARIIEYRQKNGSFKKIEDLMSVRGIGEKSFLKLKPLLTVASSKAGGQ
jgi:competence protein ComEA